MNVDYALGDASLLWPPYSQPKTLPHQESKVSTVLQGVVIHFFYIISKESTISQVSTFIIF